MLSLLYVKKSTSFCQALKKMRTKENWFLFLPHGVDHGTEGETNGESRVSTVSYDVSQCEIA